MVIPERRLHFPSHCALRSQKLHMPSPKYSSQGTLIHSLPQCHSLDILTFLHHEDLFFFRSSVAAKHVSTCASESSLCPFHGKFSKSFFMAKDTTMFAMLTTIKG